MGYDTGLDKAEKKYGVGGNASNDRFEFKQGDNKILVLQMQSDFLATHFIGRTPVLCIGEDEGCQYHGENTPVDDKGNPKRPSVKKLMYVLDLVENEVKLAYMPYSVVKAITDLSNEEDWQFSSMPMPYPINIKFDKDAAPNDMYKITPSPKQMEVPDTIIEELNKKKPLDQVADAIRAKAPRQAAQSPKANAPAAENVPLPPEPGADDINVDDIPF